MLGIFSGCFGSIDCRYFCNALITLVFPVPGGPWIRAMSGVLRQTFSALFCASLGFLLPNAASIFRSFSLLGMAAESKEGSVVLFKMSVIDAMGMLRVRIFSSAAVLRLDAIDHGLKSMANPSSSSLSLLSYLGFLSPHFQEIVLVFSSIRSSQIL